MRMTKIADGCPLLGHTHTGRQKTSPKTMQNARQCRTACGTSIPLNTPMKSRPVLIGNRPKLPITCRPHELRSKNADVFTHFCVCAVHSQQVVSGRKDGGRRMIISTWGKGSNDTALSGDRTLRRIRLLMGGSDRWKRRGRRLIPCI